MTDDLFSQLFELFNQPGPVNMKLAAEVARHVAGEAEPIDPWAAEEYRDLTRLAEYRVSEAAPFSVPAAPDVLPLDGRSWAEKNLGGYAYLATHLAGFVDLDAGGAAGLLAPLGPALIGMQLGSLVGSMATWVMASFDGGLPLDHPGPISYVVPAVERFGAAHGVDTRTVRLWVALNETAHRALFSIPFTTERLSSLTQAYAEAVRIPPERLMDMFGGMQDPSAMEGMMDPDRIRDLFENPAADAPKAELQAFLGLTAGYTRNLVNRAGSDLLPDAPRLGALRDLDREQAADPDTPLVGALVAGAGSVERGASFCDEIERRYGPDSVSRMWSSPDAIPSAAETSDPVGWAARVLLDESDLGL